MNKIEFYQNVGHNPTFVEEFRASFAKNDSDKGLGHSYHEVYGVLFPDRSRVKTVLEVGIWKGASLRAWRDLFVNAQIIGLDFNPDLFISEERIWSAYIDQRDPQTFEQLKNDIGDLTYDFVIDDASHSFPETLFTFQFFQPKIKNLGWLIVEDVKAEDVQRWIDVMPSLKQGNDRIFLVDLSPDRPHLTDNRVIAYQHIE